MKSVPSPNLNENLIDAVLGLYQQENQRIWWPFASDSMSPYIREGDVVLVQHASRRFRVGDVIVFKRAGDLVAHRVVSVRGRGMDIIYRTKGDNLRSFDPPVPRSSVLGMVICIRKDGTSIHLEKPHVKFLNYVLAGFSYLSGIFYKAARLRFSRIAD
jgi:signal peptidase I